MGYETLIGSTNHDLRQVEKCIERMIERNVDGVAIMTFGVEEPLIDRLACQGILMVFTDVALQRGGITTIEINYKQGISEAVQHLAVLGHRRIAFITDPNEEHSPDQRVAAFRSAIASIGLKLPEQCIFFGDHDVDGGSTGTLHLLNLPAPPTAIMCSNDMSAIGAMRAAFDLGLSIPKDLSLIGSDDIQLAQYTILPLTTVCMSGREIGATAVIRLRPP